MNEPLASVPPKRRSLRTVGVKEFGDLIDHFGGNVSAIARYLGYKGTDQVHLYINQAEPDVKIALNEHLARARAKADEQAGITKRAEAKRSELPAFILPHEAKALVGLYYRLTWDELQQLDIKEILSRIDEDPEAARTLRHKLSWEQLREALGDINAGFTHTFRLFDPATGAILKAWQEDLGGTVVVEGFTYNGWHEHALMSWVGQAAHSPLWERYPDLPELPPVITVHEDATGRVIITPYGEHIEKALRLLIQRLEQYL